MTITTMSNEKTTVPRETASSGSPPTPLGHPRLVGDAQLHRQVDERLVESRMAWATVLSPDVKTEADLSVR